MQLDKTILYALGSLLVGGTALAASIAMPSGNPASGSLTNGTGAQHKQFGDILTSIEGEAEEGLADSEWDELCTILANSGLQGKIYVRGRSKSFGPKPADTADVSNN